MSSIESQAPDIGSEGIYFYLADLMGFAQDVAKSRMTADVQKAEALSEVEEANAQKNYKDATTAEQAAYGEKTNGNSAAGEVAIAAIIGSSIIAALTVLGCVGMTVFSAGTLSWAAVGIGVGVGGALVAAEAGVEASVGMGAQAAMSGSNGGYDNWKEFFAGGRYNLDGNGNTIDSAKGIVSYGSADGKIDNKALASAKGDEQVAYSKIQDVQAKINTTMNVEYSEAQSAATSDQDNVKKALQDMEALTKQMR